MQRFGGYLLDVLRHGIPWAGSAFSAIATIFGLSGLSVLAALTSQPVIGVAVGLGALLTVVVAGSYRVWSKADRGLGQAQEQLALEALDESEPDYWKLSGDCLGLATEIKEFLGNRARQSARPPPITGRTLDEMQRTIGSPEYQRAMQRSVEQAEATKTEYEVGFSGPVFAVVQQLAKVGMVKEKEAHRLNYPSSPRDMWGVAERLEALGRRARGLART